LMPICLAYKIRGRDARAAVMVGPNAPWSVT
jgi:hypothetical protein